MNQIDIKNIKIDVQRTFGETLLVVGNPRPVNKYVNGKATDEIEAFRYPLLSTLNWRPLNIKVKQKDPSIVYEGTPIPVSFTNLEGKLWQDSKTQDINISLTADTIKLSAQNKIKL